MRQSRVLLDSWGSRMQPTRITPTALRKRGQCIFVCQPRNKERDIKGSLKLIDYESHKIKRTVLSTTVAELYAFMKLCGSAQFYRGL